MPRDIGNTTLLRNSPLLTAWERLGIVPVPEDFVRKYRRDYLADQGVPGSRWLTAKFNPKTWDLKTFLRKGLQNRGDNTMLPYAVVRDKTAAPKKLVALALLLQEQHPDAKFETAYCLEDPILYATLDGEKGCLGIWDEGRTVAIATKVG